jgi:hypothetical protein
MPESGSAGDGLIKLSQERRFFDGLPKQRSKAWQKEDFLF